LLLFLQKKKILTKNFRHLLLRRLARQHAQLAEVALGGAVVEPEAAGGIGVAHDGEMARAGVAARRAGRVRRGSFMGRRWGRLAGLPAHARQTGVDHCNIPSTSGAHLPTWEA